MVTIKGPIRITKAEGISAKFLEDAGVKLKLPFETSPIKKQKVEDVKVEETQSYVEQPKRRGRPRKVSI